MRSNGIYFHKYNPYITCIIRIMYVLYIYVYNKRANAHALSAAQRGESLACTDLLYPTCYTCNMLYGLRSYIRTIIIVKNFTIVTWFIASENIFAWFIKAERIYLSFSLIRHNNGRSMRTSSAPRAHIVPVTRYNNTVV